MKLLTKVGIASVGSAALIGGLIMAAPSFGSQGYASVHSEDHEASQVRGEHGHASVTATITNIPATVTDLKDAVRGANFLAFKIDTSALPETQPSEGGHVVGIKPTRSEDGTREIPEIVSGSVEGDLLIKSPLDEGTSYFALYPSDGGEAVLVTVVVDADGVATATASSELQVSYSADVAANTPAKMEHKGKRGERGQGHGPRGMRGGHGQDFDIEVAPNA